MHDFGPDEHHQEREAKERDAPSGGWSRTWPIDPVPEQRRRQATRQLPPSWVIATWAILLGIAALVVFALVSVAISAR